MFPVQTTPPYSWNKDPYFQVHYFSGNGVLVRRSSVAAPFTVVLETFGYHEKEGREELFTEQHSFDSEDEANDFVLRSGHNAGLLRDKVEAMLYPDEEV